MKEQDLELHTVSINLISLRSIKRPEIRQLL